MYGYESRLSATSYDIIINEWNCPTLVLSEMHGNDKYGNKTRLSWNEYSLELYEAVLPFRMDEYRFPEFNEHASTI